MESSDIKLTIPQRVGPLGSDSRISREQMYFGIAQVVRLRSTCLRGKVGCVAVSGHHIVAVGYNGAPPGMPHCFELGCDLEENNHDAGCQRTIHAEANVIAFAAKQGIPLHETVLYSTHGPCRKCAQLIVAAGIMRVHYLTPYRLPEGLELLDKANVPAVHHADV